MERWIKTVSFSTGLGKYDDNDVTTNVGCACIPITIYKNIIFPLLFSVYIYISINVSAGDSVWSIMRNRDRSPKYSACLSQHLWYFRLLKYRHRHESIYGPAPKWPSAGRRLMEIDKLFYDADETRRRVIFLLAARRYNFCFLIIKVPVFNVINNIIPITSQCCTGNSGIRSSFPVDRNDIIEFSAPINIDMTLLSRSDGEEK